MIAMVVAGLMMIPLLFVPPSIAWPGIVFLYLALGSLGFRLGEAKHEDLFALVGMKPRASAASARGDLHVIDTSALIDGRVADLVATGFVSGTILLHDGVLRELQAISDSSDPKRRTRGRRGLDVLVELQKAPTVQFQLIEENGVMDVDAALVRLARERGASLITVDHNLAKVAEALRVPVAQINALASKFRVPYTAGDEISVRLVKEGREHGQGVGYLDDGTMVVVERADQYIGTTVEIRRHQRDPDDDRPDGVRRARQRESRRGLSPLHPPDGGLPCFPHGNVGSVACCGHRAGRRCGPAPRCGRPEGVRHDRRPTGPRRGSRRRRGIAGGGDARGHRSSRPRGAGRGVRGVPRQARDDRERR